MGFLGGLAADAAREYVNRKGIEGMMEDMGTLKNKVSDMFSGNDDENYSQDNSEDFWSTLDSYIEEDDFQGAEVYVNNFVGKGNKDDFYYYVMAYIYNIKAVVLDSHEDERKAKNYINNAINMMSGDSDWRQSLYDLKNKIDDNLRAFKKEKEEAKQAKKEWEKLNSMFDLNSDCSGADAVTALEEYYDSRNEERDIYYHFLIYRGFEKLILKEDEPLECFYDDMKVKVGIISDIARSNPGEYGDLAKTIQESFVFWENNHYEAEVHQLIDGGNFTKAFDTVQKLKNNEGDYTRVLTRLESLRLVDMVNKGKSSESEIKKQIQVVEDVMKRACQLADDTETSGKIRTAAEERIAIAKQYLTGPKSPQQLSSSAINLSSNSEAEYIEELKACYEDGVITDKERRLLNRLRKSLGISETRAAELEALCRPQSLTPEEQEYADEVKACLEDDGVITDKERRLLNRLAKSLGLSPERVKQIEEFLIK